MIPPSAWLSLVWNNEGGEEPAFADLPHLNRVMGLVMDHYNRIAGTLFDKPEDYAPLFEVFRKRAGGASFQSRAENLISDLPTIERQLLGNTARK